MRRKLFTCASGVAKLTHLRCKIALFIVVVLCGAVVELGAGRESKDWVVLENCRLIANPANDGDSFHARARAKEYIFRLYLVDAPETDEMTPRRLVDQAKYFAVSVPQSNAMGQRQANSRPASVTYPS